ncbi:hypothetical protein J3E64_000109 [Sphingobium sp. OAS761]|uniref:hypothetical protein n=1 Tax=Sphingobium sp. OAS761 TaxID=2817901 RepID=UPI00209D696C|nr:hypothetical protein [Sphingobium sp. OAS761]MCP1468442.1 hypothetical protein [Sphingobium sp. OAS761]
MRMIVRLIALLPPLTLAACGPGSADGVGGVSASEADALNEAAARIDRQTGMAQPDGPGLNPAAEAAARADRGRRPPEQPGKAP